MGPAAATGHVHNPASQWRTRHTTRGYRSHVSTTDCHQRNSAATAASATSSGRGHPPGSGTSPGNTATRPRREARGEGALWRRTRPGSRGSPRARRTDRHHRVQRPRAGDIALAHHCLDSIRVSVGGSRIAPEPMARRRCEVVGQVIGGSSKVWPAITRSGLVGSMRRCRFVSMRRDQYGVISASLGDLAR